MGLQINETCVVLDLANPGSTANKIMHYINEKLIINNKLQYLPNVPTANMQCALPVNLSLEYA